MSNFKLPKPNRVNHGGGLTNRKPIQLRKRCAVERGTNKRYLKFYLDFKVYKDQAIRLLIKHYILHSKFPFPRNVCVDWFDECVYNFGMRELDEPYDRLRPDLVSIAKLHLGKLFPDFYVDYEPEVTKDAVSTQDSL